MSKSKPEVVQPTPDPGQPNVSTGDLQPETTDSEATDPAVAAAGDFALLDEPPAEHVKTPAAADESDTVEDVTDVTEVSELSTDEPDILADGAIDGSDITVPGEPDAVYDPILDSQTRGAELDENGMGHLEVESAPEPDPLPESTSVPADTEPDVDEDTAEREAGHDGTEFVAPNEPVEDALEGAKADVVPDDSLAHDLEATPGTDDVPDGTVPGHSDPGADPSTGTADSEEGPVSPEPRETSHDLSEGAAGGSEADDTSDLPAPEGDDPDAGETQVQVAKRLNPKLRRLAKYRDLPTPEEAAEDEGAPSSD